MADEHLRGAHFEAVLVTESFDNRFPGSGFVPSTNEAIDFRYMRGPTYLTVRIRLSLHTEPFPYKAAKLLFELLDRSFVKSFEFMNGPTGLLGYFPVTPSHEVCPSSQRLLIEPDRTPFRQSSSDTLHDFPTYIPPSPG
jgi:hypothetical protein